MGKLHVGILYGGRSVEHDISLLSAKNILQNINTAKFEIFLLAIDKSGKWYLCDNIDKPISSGHEISVILDASKPVFIANNTHIRLDVIFPILHGTDGEDGSVQGLLKTLSLAFVGSGVLGSAASMDKLLAKRVLQSAGIPVAKFAAFQHPERHAISYQKLVDQIGLPFIVKPANLGSSVGVSKVDNEEDVKRNWERLKLKEGKTSVLEGVPKSLPALVKANRIQDKVAGVGFDWEEPNQVWEKVEEELEEFKTEVALGNKETMESEFGDVIFSLVNYARFLNINPENALERTNKKFLKRFQYLESKAKALNQPLKEMPLVEMDVFWEEAKSL